jgi:hypothetical protein
MASGSDPPSRWYTIFLLPSSQVPTTWPLTGAATPIVVTVKRTTPAAAIFDRSGRAGLCSFRRRLQRWRWSTRRGRATVS